MAIEFPPLFLLPTHIDPEEFQSLQAQIGSLTNDINKTDIVVGRITQKGRARFELRRRKVETKELSENACSGPDAQTEVAPPAKRRKTGDSGPGMASYGSQIIRVVKLAWVTDSRAAGATLPLDDYMVYQGMRLNPPKASASVLRIDTGAKETHSQRENRTAPPRPPALLKETTSEHDLVEILPKIPDSLHTTYSCQRSTPNDPPNREFVDQLKKIRTNRTLENDEIGVRAYSTAIAAIAAYPYEVSSVLEVERLPGCSKRIAGLYREWKETGRIQEAEKIESDARMSALMLFYQIWGVGDTTARDFYNKGWRDLDDIIEYGWDSISRVQQIGVKYYDEFQTRIPRDEVELIGNTILQHANRLRRGFQMVICGGYRRGKADSGDVDVILSNPDMMATIHLIEELVISLEDSNHVEHTLTLSTKNSERGQTPLPWKGEGRPAGSGFDTLDKALVVWRQPSESSTVKMPSASVGVDGKQAGNPHRRVDIVISPWRTAGCAVIGWSGGTTFERDLRRYCKKEKDLKFDSSGIRSRRDGSWVDFESGPRGEPAPDMLTAEKRVFAGLGLEWRPPTERCTG